MNTDSILEAKSQSATLAPLDIQSQIIRLPGRPPAMLAQNLAELYQARTHRINEAVKRNPKRFPDDFYFSLTDEEIEFLRSQNAISNSEPILHGQTRYRPIAFTREGCNMLSAVLKTDVAAERSVQIMRAFSALERVTVERRSAEREDVEPPSMYDVLAKPKQFTPKNIKSLYDAMTMSHAEELQRRDEQIALLKRIVAMQDAELDRLRSHT